MRLVSSHSTTEVQRRTTEVRVERQRCVVRSEVTEVRRTGSRGAPFVRSIRCTPTFVGLFEGLGSVGEPSTFYTEPRDDSDGVPGRSRRR